MDWAQKTAVVTGASSGIGRAIALKFAGESAKLVLVGRDKKRLGETQAEALKAGASDARLIACDVSLEKEVLKMAESVSAECGVVDVLVNNAGFGAHGFFSERPMAEAEEQIQTNLMGTMYVTHALLPCIPPGGAIVNVSSMAGLIGFPRLAAYGASKFGVAGFSESLFHELKPRGIHVMAVFPAGTKTRFFDHPSFEGHAHRVHYEKLMAPERVADLVLEGLRQKRKEVLANVREKGVWGLKRHAPVLFHAWYARRYSAKLKKEASEKENRGNDK